MDDDEPEGTVHTVYAAELAGPVQRKTPQCRVQVNGQTVKALIDTGASINLMTQDIFYAIPNKPNLRKTHILVYAFGNGTPLPLKGMFVANASHEENAA